MTKRRRRSAVIVESTSDRIYLPDWLVNLGNRGLNAGQRALYERLFHTRVTGQAYLPPASRFVVVANHASHLDMGLVKHALGDWGERLVALAAKDYFFDDPLKRVCFENFTSLVPMERHGSLRESLRIAARVIEQGHILLIFPEERAARPASCSRLSPRLVTWRCTTRSTCCRCTWPAPTKPCRGAVCCRSAKRSRRISDR